MVLGAGLADILLLTAGDDVLLVERAADGVSLEIPGNLDRTRRSARVRAAQRIGTRRPDLLPPVNALDQ